MSVKVENIQLKRYEVFIKNELQTRYILLIVSFLSLQPPLNL